MTGSGKTLLPLLLLPLLLAACSGPQNVLGPAGREAAQSDVVWRTMVVVCGVMYALVLAFLGWALVRARRRSLGTAPAFQRTPAEGAMEKGLAGWTGLILVGLTVLVAVSFVVDRSLAQVGPEPVRIKVTANQWWWSVEYQGANPDAFFTTANELHLPVGRPALIELRANDVIHSFWVPNLSGKEDLIPGRTNYLAVTPRRTGAFRGQCAEFCGLQHAHMALDVTVESQSAFDSWRLAQQATAPEPLTARAVVGKQVFLGKACSMCHRIAGTEAGGVTGPDLTHVASRKTIAAGTMPNTRGALQAWIADPQGRKPGTSMPRVPLTADELDALVDYLATLQ